MSSNSMTNVLLLRSPSDHLPDPYDLTLRNAQYDPYSISVLETSFTNSSELQNLIYAGPHLKQYTGIIITSKRSCEAWTSALKNVLGSSFSLSDHIPSGDLPSPLVAWTQITFYVVGKGTASALQEFRILCSSHGVSSELDVRGEQTGTGEQLAHFILDNVSDNSPPDSKRLLYLTGDKNRDTMPKLLSSEKGKRLGIDLDTVQVYATQGASSFEPNIDTLVRQSSRANWWIVFFAPSSTEFAYPILQKYFRFAQKELLSPGATSLPLPIAKTAAIGHVTSSYLEEELKLHVDAVATKPTPDALLAAITAVAI